jgi:branched-subunit amino acid aminotransferase/4-amino-4-deoxychorismate lyase
MSSYIQANTNGRLHAATEPSLSPLNRGYLYGDAIYEVWRTYHGVIFGWEEHWRRLERSAAALYLVLPFTSADILTQIKKTVAAFHEQSRSVSEVYVRLQVTRGHGPIGLDIALADVADFVLLVQENKLFSEEKFNAGLRLSFARELHRNPANTLNPAWKTGNYLNNILCLREARARGADEVVITNQAGEITEAAVSNIAFIREGAVVTPPLSAGILGGITREILLTKIAPKLGVPVREETIRPEALGEMSEAFLLSSTKDLTPIAAIDDYTFTLGADTLTRKLKHAFADYTRLSAAAHPELRLW